LIQNGARLVSHLITLTVLPKVAVFLFKYTNLTQHDYSTNGKMVASQIPKLYNGSTLVCYVNSYINKNEKKNGNWKLQDS